MTTLTPQFLEKCGYNMISIDDVVSCFNDIISAHRRIIITWHNPAANTYSPQVDRILLKSFKLFPTLDSTSTEDAIHFYDHFQELTMSHLIALMPFNAIVLKHRYEGLCIPGLGMQQYANSSKALMEFLPRLIPGTLSSRFNATLAAV